MKGVLFFSYEIATHELCLLETQLIYLKIAWLNTGECVSLYPYESTVATR
jgi:hypothetical protein